MTNQIENKDQQPPVTKDFFNKVGLNPQIARDILVGDFFDAPSRSDAIYVHHTWTQMIWHKPLIVLGEHGSGKSTLSQWLTLAQTENKMELPVITGDTFNRIMPAKPTAELILSQINKDIAFSLLSATLAKKAPLKEKKSIRMIGILKGFGLNQDAIEAQVYLLQNKTLTQNQLSAQSQDQQLKDQQTKAFLATLNASYQAVESPSRNAWQYLEILANYSNQSLKKDGLHLHIDGLDAYPETYHNTDKLMTWILPLINQLDQFAEKGVDFTFYLRTGGARESKIIKAINLLPDHIKIPEQKIIQLSWTPEIAKNVLNQRIAVAGEADNLSLENFFANRASYQLALQQLDLSLTQACTPRTALIYLHKLIDFHTFILTKNSLIDTDTLEKFQQQVISQNKL